VLPGETPSCSAETGLYFVEYEKYAMVITDRTKLGQVAFGRNNNAGLSLDRFDKDSSGIFIYR
jgi:hypothetical protein